MKLNLIPVSASRGSGAKLGIPVAVVIIAVSVVLALSMKSSAADFLKRARADAQRNAGGASNAVDVSNQADEKIQIEKGPLLNLKLATAMMDHNKVYPDFYDSVMKFIPKFFRINSLIATPIDANTCTVTMNGFLGSIEQYNYLSLALLRVPGVQAVSRSGYSLTFSYVPNINKEDTVGRSIKIGEGRLTDDAVQRLDAQIAKGGHTDYLGAGGFGTLGMPRVRGAMPKETPITVALVMAGKLQTPNPRETLAGAQGAYASYKPENLGAPAPAAPAAPPKNAGASGNKKGGKK